ncbi:hypothetical protein [Fodinicurvata sp. EGI_FJ10296]|jgi:hypothetical protein|uniref:hypothetical protein n=1 Tax=Fodinicurvata sp. EGI_FJ10296 TaxID=3231908 RepID=UPI003454A010
MKRLSAAIVVGSAAIFASAAVMGAAPERIQQSVYGVMQQHGIPMNSGSLSIHEMKVRTGDNEYSDGYRAWVEIPGGEPGYLVVELRPSGSVKQVYTRFGGRIAGVPSY